MQTINSANEVALVGRSSNSLPPAPLFRLLCVLFFLILLAGQFSFARAGLPNLVLIQENLFGLILVTFFTVVMLAGNRTKLQSVPRAALLIFVPLTYYLFTGLWGAQVPDLQSTVLDLIGLLFAYATVVLLLSWNRRVLAETFLWCSAVAGAIYSLVGLMSLTAGVGIAAFGGGSNVFSRVTSLGVVAVVGLVSLSKVPRIALALCPLMLSATILSGSRGGMLSLAAALCVLVPLIPRVNFGRLISGGVLISGAIVFVYARFAASIDQIVQGRVVDLTLEQRYSAGRDTLLQSARELYSAEPIMGGGLRSFAEYSQVDVYPHNLFAQTAAEGGTVGLFFIVLTIMVFLRSMLRRRIGTLALIYLSAATIIFVSSMFSGDYYDARFLWVFMAVALCSVEVRRHPQRSSVPA